MITKLIDRKNNTNQNKKKKNLKVYGPVQVTAGISANQQ